MTLEQKRNIAITIRLSESEAETLNRIAKTQHQTKTAVLVTALTMYARSLTAANTSPAEISQAHSNSGQPTGAETAPATATTSTETDSPEEISSTTTSASPEEIERLKRAAFLDGMETARRYFRHGQRHGRQARRRVKAAPAPKK